MFTDSESWNKRDIVVGRVVILTASQRIMKPNEGTYCYNILLNTINLFVAGVLGLQLTIAKAQTSER